MSMVLTDGGNTYINRSILDMENEMTIKAEELPNMTDRVHEKLKTDLCAYFNAFAPEYEMMMHNHTRAVVDRLAAIGALSPPVELIEELREALEYAKHRMAHDTQLLYGNDPAFLLHRTITVAEELVDKALSKLDAWRAK